MATLAPAPMGHNQPEPFDLFKEHIEELYEQAAQFLDGEPVQTDEQAEDVSRLLNMLRKASNDADDARKAEKKPHDDAAKAVQSKWKPILDKADLAVSTAKRALQPFLQKKEDEQRAAAEAARQEAEEKAAAARNALTEAGSSLSAREEAETLLKQAGAAEKQAARLDKAKAQARGGERAIALRTSYRAEITDETAFARWVWANRHSEITEFLQSLADRESRGGDKGIPGVTVHTERKAA